MGKILGWIEVAILFGGGLFALYAGFAAVTDYQQAIACCRTDWVTSTWWWLVTSKIAVSIAAMLVTAAFAIVLRKWGPSAMAPFLFGISYVVLSVASYIAFRSAGKDDGPDGYWPGVVWMSLVFLMPAVIFVGFLLRIAIWSAVRRANRIGAR